MNQEELKIIVEEVARVALEKDYRHVIGHELDLSDEEMEKVYQILVNKLNEGVL